MVADALAGLRANEARYYKNKYNHVFTVSPVSEAPEALGLVTRVLADERGLVISARPLEATAFEVDGIRMSYVFYESGLAINVMYTVAEAGKRAVGFKLSEGMEIPEELTAAVRASAVRSVCMSSLSLLSASGVESSKPRLMSAKAANNICGSICASAVASRESTNC